MILIFSKVPIMQKWGFCSRCRILHLLHREVHQHSLQSLHHAALQPPFACVTELRSRRRGVPVSVGEEAAVGAVVITCIKVGSRVEVAFTSTSNMRVRKL